MTFIQAFENIKSRLDKNGATAKIDTDFAIQVELTNKDCSGIFYLQNKDGKLIAEPYDYYDNNIAISVSYLYFSKLIDGRIVPSKAIEKGNISAVGNLDILDAICGIVPEVQESKKKPVAKTESKPTLVPAKEATKPAKTEIKSAKVSSKSVKTSKSSKK